MVRSDAFIRLRILVLEKMARLERDRWARARIAGAIAELLWVLDG